MHINTPINHINKQQSMHVYHTYFKMIFTVIKMSIKMSTKNINFDNKKIKKSDFHKKKKKTYLIQMILMLIKNQFLKMNHTANIIHLNTLLNIMLMM